MAMSSMSSMASIAHEPFPIDRIEAEELNLQFIAAIAEQLRNPLAINFVVVPTINFRLLSVLVILRHERRCLITLIVTDHPTAEWIAQ